MFCADSQLERMESNLESLENLKVNLKEQGYDINSVPYVLQYNKRDLPSALPVERLRALLNVPPGVPEVMACALFGKGVFETVKAVTKACLAVLGDPADMAEGRSPSILPGQRPSMFPGAVPPAARSRNDESTVPVFIPSVPRLPSMTPEPR